jgi:predicted NUDIX family NTP pyrophosphohydrolase
MSKQSAGLLLYRDHQGDLEVLLVHPGGPFWAKKDLGVWSIPKGELGADEVPLDAARREFSEETGLIAPEGKYLSLTPVEQKGGKMVHAWAVKGDLDPESISSNTFEMAWPPWSKVRQRFPEVDRAAWFPVEVALGKINAGQAGLIRELVERLRERSS